MKFIRRDKTIINKDTVILYHESKEADKNHQAIGDYLVIYSLKLTSDFETDDEIKRFKIHSSIRETHYEERLSFIQTL